MDAPSRTRARSRPLRVALPLTATVCLGGAGRRLLGPGSGGSSSSDSTTQAAAASVERSAERLPEGDQGRAAVRRPGSRPSSGLGSGVVYDDEGHIVTNAHVVGDERDVQGDDVDERDSADRRSSCTRIRPRTLAVIKLEKVPDGLRAAEFADSSKVEVGQITLAMGSPLGSVVERHAGHRVGDRADRERGAFRWGHRCHDRQHGADVRGDQSRQQRGAPW
ncbi:trypsin-like peptidase domain-containing protein [Streptomyces sp. KL116D]|uniref:trypsin-like peptidase domain-containing protein n=1 Tax=Streptomyces sp. KL116D TaxID=3045152 RepID=UPI003558612F